jgi:hypothetical protein
MRAAQTLLAFLCNQGLEASGVSGPKPSESAVASSCHMYDQAHGSSSSSSRMEREQEEQRL